MTELILPSHPTIADVQKYVREMEQERGFTNEDIAQKCLLLGEEVGELFKAIRKSEGIKTDHASHIDPIEDELADILIYLSAIANRYGIDLEKAFRDKEEKNKKRTWK